MTHEDVACLTEPKSGLKVGMWFNDERCRGYHGTLPVVIELKAADLYLSRFAVSRCPPCEWWRIQGENKNFKVKRWLILPP